MADDKDPRRDDATDVVLTENPPTRLVGILQRLGPGLIIAGSIVGSGELIATTKTGAEAGFWLLWLILIGCVIKVFVQVEMGRYSVTTGKTTMDGLAEVPGPYLPGRGNWLIWFWALVFLATIGQVGGIVGGVGQALQISVPITEAGRQYNAQVDDETQYTVARSELRLAEDRAAAGDRRGDERAAEVRPRLAQLADTFIARRLEVGRQQLAQLEAESAQAAPAKKPRIAERLAIVVSASDVIQRRLDEFGPQPELVFAAQKKLDGHAASDIDPDLDEAIVGFGKLSSNDDKYWALVMAVITATLLVLGRYGLIQSFSTVLVASFTFITVINLVMLQNNAYWAVTWTDLANGLSFRLPPPSATATTATSVATALATFGIIGVGTNELIAYPYWCLEKGYARFTGPRDKSSAWADRARGWMRVMNYDAWCSMIVYTFATLAFYLLGAAILWRTGLNPGGNQMIRTLGVMYEPVFGSIARWVFLFGAFAVLYSTYFVATASLARVVPDGLRVMGLGPQNQKAYRVWIRVFSGIFPFLCAFAYILFESPAVMVLIGGVTQGLMLPMLATAALYFRYRRSDPRIAPGRVWNVFLWLSAVGLLITGLWTAWSEIMKFF